MVANIIMAQGVAKLFINMSFSSIYVYSSELFPTVVRYFFISNFPALCHFPKARNKRKHTHWFVLSYLNMDLPPSPQPTRSRIWFSSFIFFVSIFKINNKWINKRLIDCISRLSVCLSDSLTSLLTDWLNYWPNYWSLMTNWLTDCVTDWLTVLLTSLPTDQSTVLLTYSLSYWLTFGLKGCLTDWPSYWLIDWLTDWLPSCDTIFTISQNDLRAG